MKLIRYLHRFEDGLLVVALLAMLAMALLQILLRNFFDSGFLWAESFLRVLVLWVAMLGAMVATRERNHISINLLSRVLRPQAYTLLRKLAMLFSVLVCGAAAWFSAEYVSYEYQDQTLAFADVPVWVCQSILPVGFAVMALRLLISMFDRAEFWGR